jgi:hypothetical protein
MNPLGARSVICAYCGARLEVLHIGGVADRTSLGREQNPPVSSTPQQSIGDQVRPAGDRLQRPAGWQVVASFKFVHDWHQAAHALAHAGIVARMQDDPKDASYSALAVPAPDADIARQLLPASSIGTRAAG